MLGWDGPVTCLQGEVGWAGLGCPTAGEWWTGSQETLPKPHPYPQELEELTLELVGVNL